MTVDASAVSALRADPAFATLRRSLDVYYGDARRDAAMDVIYARFVKPGDLAFDIGYITQNDFDRLLQDTVEVSRIVGALCASVERRRNSLSNTRR